VIKYDSYGDMLWNKTTEGRVSSDSGYGIAIDSEDNIIITGETHSFGDSDVLVIKYDSYGNVIWNKTSGGKPESYGKESACVSGTNTVIIGGSSEDHGEDITVDSNNNILVVGTTWSFGAGGYDIWTIKYGPRGNILWNRTAGGSLDDVGYDIAVDSNDNIVIAGTASSFSAGLWVIKYDSSGNILWNRTAGGSLDDGGYSIAIDVENNIIITGYTHSSDIGSTDIDVWTIKYDSSGNVLWNKTIGGKYNDAAQGVSIDSNNNVIVTGYTDSFGAEKCDIWTIGYDSSGNVLWNKTTGGKYYDEGYGVAVDSNNDIIITGSTTSFGAGSEEVWIIKYAQSGHNPTNQLSENAKKALRYISQTNNVSEEQLEIVNEGQATFSTTNEKLWGYKILDKKSRKVYGIYIDENGEITDFKKAEERENDAYKNKYGKLEQALYEKLQNMSSNEKIKVGIWLTPIDSEEIENRVSAKYNIKTIRGRPMVPDKPDDWNESEVMKLRDEIFEEKKKAYLENAKPLIADLKEKNLGYDYVSISASIVFATLPKEEILEIEKRDDVVEIYLPENYTDESIPGKLKPPQELPEVTPRIPTRDEITLNRHSRYLYTEVLPGLLWFLYGISASIIDAFLVIFYLLTKTRKFNKKFKIIIAFTLAVLSFIIISKIAFSLNSFTALGYMSLLFLIIMFLSPIAWIGIILWKTKENRIKILIISFILITVLYYFLIHCFPDF
jgi:hypothetical protein